MITPQELVDAMVSPRILNLDFDPFRVYIYTDPATGSDNQVPRLPNYATPTNFWEQTAAASRFTHASGILSDPTAAAFMTLTTATPISSDTSFDLCYITRKVAANTRNFIVGFGTAGSQNTRIDIMWNGNQSPNNGHTILEKNASATIINQVNFVDTSLNFRKVRWTGNGTVYRLWIDDVEQTLTANVGTNTGKFCGGLSVAPTNIPRGAVPGLNGSGDFKYFRLCGAVQAQTFIDLEETYMTEQGI
jgi:hypothetical protein